MGWEGVDIRAGGVFWQSSSARVWVGVGEWMGGWVWLGECPMLLVLLLLLLLWILCAYQKGTETLGSLNVCLGRRVGKGTEV